MTSSNQSQRETRNEPPPIPSLKRNGWLSLTKFARLIVRRTYPTVKRMVDEGRINVVVVGGVYRVYADEIMRYLDINESSMISKPPRSSESTSLSKPKLSSESDSPSKPGLTNESKEISKPVDSNESYVDSKPFSKNDLGITSID